MEDNYCNVVKKVKKDNITPNNISEIILCQIPGISAKTAMSITKPFQSFHEMMRTLENNPEYLEQLKIEGPNGKSRKLSKTIAQNINRFLLPPPLPK